MDHVIGFATRGISKGLALGFEAAAQRKGSKDQSQEDDNLTTQEWDLDDAAGDEREHDEAPSTTRTPEEISRDFFRLHDVVPPPAYTPKRLPGVAVVIPQRRPRQRSRGFIRAYAPVLNDCGINQKTFLDFLRDLDRASQASPIFDAINIACFGIGMVPGHITLIVSTVVGTTNMIAQEIASRYKSNKFLDEMNKNLFRPRGLIAMVMAYQPDLPDDPVVRVDSTSSTTTAAYKSLTSSDSTLKKAIHRLKQFQGTTAGEADMPIPAPLIYPHLDSALAAQPNSSATSKLKQSGFINDYLDHRAQASFALQNPAAKLTDLLPPQKQYSSRFADPDHRVNNGSVFALLTGGTVDPIGESRVLRAQAAAKRNGQAELTKEEKHEAFMGRKVRGRVTGTPSKDNVIIRRLFKRDVLYLVVMNLPTQEEIQRLEEELARASREGGEREE